MEREKICKEVPTGAKSFLTIFELSFQIYIKECIGNETFFGKSAGQANVKELFPFSFS